MAQKRYFNFKASLQSNDFNYWLLGILEPGRIRGFDGFQVTGLNFDIVHTTTGIKQTKEDLSQTGFTGVAITRHGCVIQEDAAITGLSCTTNSGNGSIRTDLVVLDHEDVNVIGGQAATYIVIRGTNGTSAAPALSSPTKQVIIGTITIPANATDLTAATYSPAQCPLVGGHNLLTEHPELDARFAKLGAGGPNNFTAQNREASIAYAVSGGKATLPTTGNVFIDAGGTITINEMDSVRLGFTAKLLASGTVTINLSQVPAVGGLTIVCDALSDLGATSLVLEPTDWVEMVQVNFFTDIWVITNFSTSLARRLKITEDFLDETNPQGLITTTVDIGDWDMDTNATKSVSLGVTSDKIRSITGMVRDDSNAAFYPLPYNDATPVLQAWIAGSGSGSVTLIRLGSGFFDSVNFNQTSYNRGWLTITHIP